jgi:hypothetical protein
VAAPADCHRHEAAGDHAPAVEWHVAAGFHARILRESLHAGKAVTHAGNGPDACEWAMAGAMPGKPRAVDALIGLLGHLPRGYLDDFAVEVAESWQAAPR